MSRKTFLLMGVALFTMAAGLLAQKKEKGDSNVRSVQGAVRTADDAAVVGAVVQLKDMKSLQVRSFITRDDGNYHFQGLNPNVDYELKAEFQGTSSDTKTLSVFDSRTKAIINLKLSKE
jgi:hypothetical protein